jgi:hypothetical protein
MIRAIFDVFLDALTFIELCFRPTTTVAAENLFPRKDTSPDLAADLVFPPSFGR